MYAKKATVVLKWRQAKDSEAWFVFVSLDTGMLKYT